MRKIFVTGISGCVGHYLFDLLAPKPDCHLYLLVRNPAKLLFDPSKYRNLTIIQDDLANIEKHSALLKEMDAVVHLAADWAGNEGNFEYSLPLLAALDPGKCQRVIYFSTASILGPDGKAVPQAETAGTHYVRGKYYMHKMLPRLPIHRNTVTLFPTWVIGGDKAHPYSHAAGGLKEIAKWLWLIRWFTVDASFHFIHAQDIAAITAFLLDHEVKEQEYILGNKALTATDLIRQVCAYHGIKVGNQLTIGLPLVKTLAALTGHRLHSWDEYCFERRHFTYNAVNAETFGLRSDLLTVAEVLAAIGG
jgi:nucleoside-diphosphate-sugar epimerase